MMTDLLSKMRNAARYSEYVRVHFFYPLECAQARAIRSYSTVSIENEEDGGID